jgi:hypothetical protein
VRGNVCVCMCVSFWTAGFIFNLVADTGLLEVGQ